jgi:hypothetical protein
MLQPLEVPLFADNAVTGIAILSGFALPHEELPDLDDLYRALDNGDPVHEVILDLGGSLIKVNTLEKIRMECNKLCTELKAPMRLSRCQGQPGMQAAWCTARCNHPALPAAARQPKNLKAALHVARSSQPTLHHYRIRPASRLFVLTAASKLPIF